MEDIEDKIPETINVEGIRISPNQILHGVYKQEQNMNKRTFRNSLTHEVISV